MPGLEEIKTAPPIADGFEREKPPPSSGKAIIHRDQVHGDVHYDRLAVALLNTSALQRLGKVYQLGYAHLVFRGGTHTRLSHVMGAAHMAGKIVDSLRTNYRQKRAAQPKHVVPPKIFLPAPVAKSEDDRWDVLRHVVAWAALLHDLGHIPLGHTLEDEFDDIFKKHDDFSSPRSSHLWSKDSDIFSILTNRSLYPASFERCGIDPLKVWQTILLICFYKDIDKDRYGDFERYLQENIKVLSRELENPAIRKHSKKSGLTIEEFKEKKITLENEHAFTSVLLDAVQNTNGLFQPYMTDIVANTICADYLDYVRRDPVNVGLDVLRDDRILSHFYVSVEPKTHAHRMALALLDGHGKPRLDVCTGVVEQVRQRYRFAESIYYHKTKVSTSAMFAKAMALIGKPREIGEDQTLLFDADNLTDFARGLVKKQDSFLLFRNRCLPTALTHPEIGDDSLHLFMLSKAVDNIKNEIDRYGSIRSRSNKNSTLNLHTEKVEAQLRGIALLQAITRRKLYKVGISINAQQFGKLTKGSSPTRVVEDRLKEALRQLRNDRLSKNLRARLEQKMAAAAGWPPDSILLYVPPRKNQAKGIETFAFDQDGVVRLNEHPAVAEKVNELSRDYQNLWRLLVLVHPNYQNRIVEFSSAVDFLVNALWSDFDDVFDADLHDPNRVAVIKEITRLPYIRKEHREAAQRFERLAQDPNEENNRVDWDLFERAPLLTTELESGLAPQEYAERAFLVQTLVSRNDQSEDSEQKSIEQIKMHFPNGSDLIIPKNIRMMTSELRNANHKNLTSRATERADRRRALELEYIASEIFELSAKTITEDTQLTSGAPATNGASRTHRAGTRENE